MNLAAQVINQDSFISYGGILAALIGGVALVLSAKVSKGVKPTLEALAYIKETVEKVEATGLATQQLTINHIIAHSDLGHKGTTRR